MKTEGLTLEEARVALAQEDEIVDAEGCHWRWKAESNMEFRTSDNDPWRTSVGGPTETETTYRIIKPESKRLSFEEALATGGARVSPPKDTGVWHMLLTKSDVLGWSLHDLAILDLAERRGWPIVEVEKGV